MFRLGLEQQPCLCHVPPMAKRTPMAGGFLLMAAILIGAVWGVAGGNPMNGIMIGTGVALFAVTSVVASIAQLLLGKIESMSASALVAALFEAVASGAVTIVFAVMLARIYTQLAGNIAQASVPSSGT